MSEFELFFQNKFDDQILHLPLDKMKVAVKEFAEKAFNAGESVGYLEGSLSGYAEGFATAEAK